LTSRRVIPAPGCARRRTGQATGTRIPVALESPRRSREWTWPCDKKKKNPYLTARSPVDGRHYRDDTARIAAQRGSRRSRRVGPPPLRPAAARDRQVMAKNRPTSVRQKRVKRTGSLCVANPVGQAGRPAPLGPHAGHAEPHQRPGFGSRRGRTQLSGCTRAHHHPGLVSHGTGPKPGPPVRAAMHL